MAKVVFRRDGLWIGDRSEWTVRLIQYCTICLNLSVLSDHISDLNHTHKPENTMAIVDVRALANADPASHEYSSTHE